MQGHFVVKQNNGEFNAVAPDMKLEQTIQKSDKSLKGIMASCICFTVGDFIP